MEIAREKQSYCVEKDLSMINNTCSPFLEIFNGASISQSHNPILVSSHILVKLNRSTFFFFLVVGNKLASTKFALASLS
jgi:hypothetical protein